jgi:hypothetical protein
MSSDRGQRLGSSERLFAAIRRFAPTNLVRVIAIEGRLPPQRIRAVLPALQARHPLLNVRIEGGVRPAFVSAGVATLALRVIKRRDPEHWRSVLEQLLNTPIEQCPGPLLQLHYVYAATQPRAELLVVCDHVICDGVSVNALCAELLALCAGESVGPALRPLPVLDELLPPFGVVRRALDYGRALATFGRAAVLRRAHESRSAGRITRFLTSALTLEQTQALLARCHAEQTTLTGALMAASLRAIQTVRVTSPRLLLALPVNLRPHLPQHALTPDDLGNFTNVVHLDGDGGRDEFWSNARALKGSLAQVATSRRLLSSLGLIYRTGRLFVRRSRPPFAHALLSNSGIVPVRGEYGAFRAVEFFSANSASMLSADFALFCNTFERRLRFNLVFLEEVVEPRIAGQVLEALTAWLALPARLEREPQLPREAGAA